MAKHIVCLTFDHDNMSPSVARGMTTPTQISRGDFGIVAVPRILALLKKYDVATTWFSPGHTIETYPDCARAVFAAGHEIAHHSWAHITPTALSREEEEADLVRGNEAINRLTGKYARGYRSPSWDLSPHTLDLLLKHDFIYDSSMMADDYTPYHVREADVIEPQKSAIRGAPTGLVEMPISWALNDFPVFDYMRLPTGIQTGLMNGSAVLENWFNDFLYMTRNLDWGILTYTFHPHIIGRGHRLMILEKLIALLIEHGAEFMTMEDAAAAYRRRIGAE
jgi:peptidoglycan/xylan/chitin deacetylase (PgdA/CDA1 family)